MHGICLHGGPIARCCQPIDSQRSGIYVPWPLLGALYMCTPLLAFVLYYSLILLYHRLAVKWMQAGRQVRAGLAEAEFSSSFGCQQDCVFALVLVCCANVPVYQIMYCIVLGGLVDRPRLSTKWLP